ncbi:hypothetical protein VNO77_28012 [Canavalia gladiata]|uniref:Uncharacterized protein n=1 Tax=Canavalia gladiata TaxID=3824 RepID=A0AAN9Q711_CANGL
MLLAQTKTCAHCWPKQDVRWPNLFTAWPYFFVLGTSVREMDIVHGHRDLMIRHLALAADSQSFGYGESTSMHLEGRDFVVTQRRCTTHLTTNSDLNNQA